MFVPLPNLDDRRFADLVDEALARIPVQAPSWTNYNESDPGITLIEALAWITEGDIYRLNRISDEHTLAFLSLIGVAPQGPAAAMTAVQFVLQEGPKVVLPATTELNAKMLDDTAAKFRLLDALTVLPTTISQVQVLSGGKLRDVTGDWSHRRPIALFGFNPQPGDAFYLGLTGDVKAGDVLKLYIGFEGEKASRAERQRIFDEIQNRAEACAAPVACGTAPAHPAIPALPPHHSVTLAWETQTQSGVWETLAASDQTRSMTLSGTVALSFTSPPVAAPLFVLRCRLVSGAFDAAPMASAILENATEAEQASPMWQRWTLAMGAVARGTPAAPDELSSLRVAFAPSGTVMSLDFSDTAEGALTVRVLAFVPATTTAEGSLTVEAMRVANGSGAPHQLYQLSGPELVANELSVYTVEADSAKLWSAVDSFLGSGPADHHYVVDAGEAEILFGDGQNGRVPPAGAVIVVSGAVTSGLAGNVPVAAFQTLDAGPHNAALFDVAAAGARLRSIVNPNPAHGGAEAETIEHCEGRAALLVDEPARAVTRSDCELLALATPGTCISRASAIVNYFPGMQCYSAPGMMTVVVVPSLPLGRPVPSAGLLDAVRAYLSRRSVLGTRIEAIGPDFLEVAVTASVKALTGQSKTLVQQSIVAALTDFLDPLAGGPAGSGWPLGRTVYISEILNVIAQVPGADYVISLTLTAAGCGAQCGDLCLNPLALTASGTHVIQVS